MAFKLRSFPFLNHMWSRVVWRAVLALMEQALSVQSGIVFGLTQAEAEIPTAAI